MGFSYEVIVAGDIRSQPVNMVYCVWDGNESETPDDIADVFENDHLVDLAALQVNDLTWSQIFVNPLDVTNPSNALVREVSIVGSNTQDDLPSGVHMWVKFISDDNGFKSGGKLVPGFAEDDQNSGLFTSVTLAAIQAVFEALIVDLVAAGLNLAIYRPSLSSPGFPQISTVSNVLARGLGTNNRRQQPFQAA